ncbi:MAG: SLBB domain-containing protein [Acidimicrobiia bacterium]|nr:SLBB domain-containing protein [Acidimicrobiia bacterium]
MTKDVAMPNHTGHRRVLPTEPIESLEAYLMIGGGRALDAVARQSPEDVIAQLRAAGLRGRGGAGFPTATKWQSILRGGGRHHYVVCNAAEGEPGTFKDRAIIRANPYQVIEGLVAAAWAVGAIEAFVVIKASFIAEGERLERAIGECTEAGWFTDLPITLVEGPEEYLLGEEKALLEVIEGNDPLPRWLPPYLHGLYATAPQLGWQGHDPETGHSGEHMANPTLVNNAETLAQAAWILAHDADTFRSVGTASSPGTLLVTVVGDVAAPAVIEVPMGTTIRQAIDACGGALSGRTIKAVIPGVANGVLPAAALDTPLTYEDMAAAGSGLGAGGIICYDDTACMVEVAATLSRFLYVESCGQCLPCKLGTGHITEALDHIRDGHGTEHDIETIGERLHIVDDGNRCYLPTQEKQLISSMLAVFPDDFALHLEGGCAAPGRPIPTPKLTDLTDGVATYDARQDRKQPDWSYT